MSKVFTVACPKCGTDVKWGAASPHRPFCSKQCQMIDFGGWADEENSILAHRICLMLTVGREDSTNLAQTIMLKNKKAETTWPPLIR